MAQTRFKWHRLLVSPATRVEERRAGVTTLRVDGLVCSSVCAVRTKRALLALDGVEEVRVDFEEGTATIRGREHDATAYEGAVTGAVAGKLLRRLIERLANRYLRSPARAAH